MLHLPYWSAPFGRQGFLFLICVSKWSIRELELLVSLPGTWSSLKSWSPRVLKEDEDWQKSAGKGGHWRSAETG